MRPRCSQSSGPTQPSSASLTTSEVYQVYRHYTISLDAATIQDCAGLALFKSEMSQILEDLLFGGLPLYWLLGEGFQQSCQRDHPSRGFLAR